jgi:hypothetical protein
MITLVEGLGRKRPWSHFKILAWRDGGNTQKPSVRILGVAVQIPIGLLPNKINIAVCANLLCKI